MRYARGVHERLVSSRRAPRALTIIGRTAGSTLVVLPGLGHVLQEESLAEGVAAVRASLAGMR